MIDGPPTWDGAPAASKGGAEVQQASAGCMHPAGYGQVALKAMKAIAARSSQDKQACCMPRNIETAASGHGYMSLRINAEPVATWHIYRHDAKRIAKQRRHWHSLWEFEFRAEAGFMSLGVNSPADERIGSRCDLVGVGASIANPIAVHNLTVGVLSREHDTPNPVDPMSVLCASCPQVRTGIGPVVAVHQSP